MLSYNHGTWTMGQILLVTISILAVLDATEMPTLLPAQSTQSIQAISVSGPTQSPAGNNSSDVTEKSTSVAQSGTSSTVLPGPTPHNPTGSETTSIPLTEKNDTKRNINQTTGPEPTFTSMPPEGTTIRHSVLQSGENSTKHESTTQIVQSSNTATMPLQVIGTQIASTQTTVVQGSIACLGLGNFTSNLQVACFQYEEETTCETLDKQKKEDLRSFLCEIMNSPQCNITIHSSEVQPKCILWVPTSKDAEDRLKTSTSKTQLPTPMKWGQISDHQTRSQKTMIALVTCGVLLAAIILAGYFLSNRESWSPGRQRLGEDPYCTETDSQGNTLVSVSAHAQDKPNNGTRENGTGQTVPPAATNGHSTKKQTVSDTEL